MDNQAAIGIALLSAGVGMMASAALCSKVVKKQSETIITLAKDVKALNEGLQILVHEGQFEPETMVKVATVMEFRIITREL
jgi:hypothetical protein